MNQDGGPIHRNVHHKGEPDEKPNVMNTSTSSVSSQGAVPNYLKTKIAYQVIVILFGLITMIIAIISSSGVGSYTYAVSDFTANWNLRPIVDIKTALSECPAGYENLINAEWPGTQVGCDCTYSFRYNTKLATGTCDANQTQSGCRTVSPTKPMPLNKFYSYKICGQRSGSNFVDIERPKKQFGGTGAECSYGYKL